jgi:phage replication O-like protein O
MPNPQLEDGYTKIANEIMDKFCCFRIPGEVRQVVDAIVRKTYGWNKKEDWIAHSQIIAMTTLLKGSVSRGLSKAITHKLVIGSDNKLRLNKNLDEWIEFGEGHFNPKKLSKAITEANQVIASETKVIASETKVIASAGNKRHYTKETITKEKEIHPKTKIEEYTDQEFRKMALEWNVKYSFVKEKYDKLVTYIGDNPRKYSSFERTLRDWVKTDARKYNLYLSDSDRESLIINIQDQEPEAIAKRELAHKLMEEMGL